MPQPALAHHPVRAGAVFQRAAGVEKQQHVVIAIAKLAVAAADAQGRTLDRSHGDAGQQADAHGQAEVAVIHDVGRHVGHGSTGFARGVRAFVQGNGCGCQFNECHVTRSALVTEASLCEVHQEALLACTRSRFCTSLRASPKWCAV
ncbi:MAG: hypothetical protein U1E74_03775 [Paenacidovorax caeni]